MIKRIFITALAAGLLAGVFASLLQAVTTTPLILQAETYEQAEPGQEQKADAAAPSEEFERFLSTLLANAVMAVGFSFLLIAGFALHGEPVNGVRGLQWGIAGFAVFTLAPALGLPPEVPGALAADLTGRQGWWFFAVASAAAGLGCLAFARSSAVKALGLLMMAAPHVWGAPNLSQMGGSAPPELAARFAAASITSNALFWAVNGWFSGHIYGRMSH